MTSAEVLRKLERLKGQTEELQRGAEGLLTAMEILRAGEISQLPVVMDMLQDWSYRLGEYLTWLVNLEDYLKS